MKIFITLLLCCLTVLFTQAQQEASVWYFGEYAGLEFTNGSPELLTNSAMYASSGCSVISDNIGQLLFYTNGNKVWNRNHLQMPNGTSLNGSQLLNQNSFIVPFPESNDMYYLFTINANVDSVGLNYSVINMNMDNGQGDVVVKNQLLAKGLLEKITGASHCNGKDIWVVCHDPLDGFVSFLLSSDSLTKQPVKSNTGNNARGDIGYLKMSPASNRIAMPLNSGHRLVELSRFNNRSGKVFDPMLIYAKDSTVYAYGIEFSPDGNYLYFSTGGKAYKVWQYDVTLPTEDEMNNSGQLIAEGNHYAMQLALDGKIYMAKENRDYLSVISTPNLKGTDCNYQEFGVDLKSRNSLMGMPNFLPFYFYKPVLYVDGSCLGDTSFFRFPQFPNSDSIVWDFGDDSDKVSTTSSGEVQYLYQDIGDYRATIFIYHCDVTDTVSQTIRIVEKPQPDLGNDTIICHTCTILLDGGDGMEYWIWQDGNEGQFYETGDKGMYTVKVWKDGCTASDSVLIGKASTQVMLPNAFTPNGDGLNDEFKPVSNVLISDYRMIVFNRWGNLIFESSEPEQGWNGSCPSGDCQPGVYNWKITYTVQEDTEYISKSKKGTVLLLK